MSYASKVGSGGGSTGTPRFASRKRNSEPAPRRVQLATRDTEAKPSSHVGSILEYGFDTSPRLLYRDDLAFAPATRGLERKMANSREPRVREIGFLSSPDISENESDDESSSDTPARDIPVDLRAPQNRRKAAKKRRNDDSDGSFEAASQRKPMPLEPSADLARAFKNISLSTLVERRHPVFSSRALRKGFIGRCRRDGIADKLVPPPTGFIDVTVTLEPDVEIEGDEPQEHSFSCKGWTCPFGCRAFRNLPNRELLDRHLADTIHDNAEIEWTEPELEGHQSRWKLSIDLPESADTDFEYPSDSSSPSPLPSRTPSPEFPPEGGEMEPDIPIPHPLVEVAVDTPVKVETQDEPAQGVPEIKAEDVDDVPEPSAPKLPNPIDKFLVPRIQPPYLPVQAYDGSMAYSCRPRGPKLYDLLVTLSLEEYGLQSWSIVEHEEEIFETDDLRDEDKLLAALFNRWVILYRQDMVRDRFRCITEFVRKQGHLIRDWVGLRSFRNFLMCLICCRLLTSPQVAELLKMYHKFIGLDINALARNTDAGMDIDPQESSAP